MAVNFPYPAFALLIAANGIGSGMFASPNSSSIMGSVPAPQRGAAWGMRSTFQNIGTAVSIGMFFSVMIAGPFQHGLIVVFALATVLTGLAALASALRGDRPVPAQDPDQQPDTPAKPI